MTARRILVLGANGFLGGAIRRLLEADPECGEAVLHFRSDPPPDALPDDTVEWGALDLRQADAASLTRFLDAMAPEVVINCVGATGGEPDEMRESNAGIARKLVAALDGRTGVHLVHLGSAAEYGMQHEGQAVAEHVYATPLSAYGVTKLEATELFMAAAAERRITVTVLRVFNPLGAHSPETSLPGRAASCIAAALEGGHDSVRLGSLDSWRDYIDIRDVASATLAAAELPPRGGIVLNVGRGEAVQSRHLVRALAKIAGYTGAIIESEDGSRRSARLNWQQADITAIHQRLGWDPRFSFDDTLRDLWDHIPNGSLR